MSWDSLTWRPAGLATIDGVASLAELVPIFQSALDEAVSAFLMAPGKATALDIADASLPLPDEFAPLATFELLGATRRPVHVAIDPAGGLLLGGALADPLVLGRAMLEGLDGAVEALAGEGLSIGPADAASFPSGAPLVCVRVTVQDASGTSVGIVAAVGAEVPVEFATHIVALQALESAGHGAAPAPAPPVLTAPQVVAEPPRAALPEPQPLRAPEPPPAPAPAPAIRAMAYPELGSPAPVANGHNIELLLGVNLQVTVEIGRARMPIRQVLGLTPGSIVELDKLAGEKVDVLVNGHPIAQGEVVVVDDSFGVRITDVVSRQRRIMSADGAA